MSAVKEEIIEAGQKLLVMLYGGKPNDMLNHMRYVKYMHLLATNKARPLPEQLPPTERAAYFHLLRVHLQVAQWESLTTEVPMAVEDWGWKKDQGMYSPIDTDQNAAPDDLLTVISCKCKTSTKKPCSSNICSCRKHGLHCVAACNHCYGELCENTAPLRTCSILYENDVDGDGDGEGTSEMEFLTPDDLENVDSFELYEEIVETTDMEPKSCIT